MPLTNTPTHPSPLQQQISTQNSHDLPSSKRTNHTVEEKQFRFAQGHLWHRLQKKKHRILLISQYSKTSKTSIASKILQNFLIKISNPCIFICETGFQLCVPKSSCSPSWSEHWQSCTLTSRHHGFWASGRICRSKVDRPLTTLFLLATNIGFHLRQYRSSQNLTVLVRLPGSCSRVSQRSSLAARSRKQ